ncbi:MAG: hypothetical protein M1828_003332 [Chrysothrix sp. TS-e1954]|nr:MAG: hypothetical protein M1828_003332 [Chrysothrix sp. TS-e1954]
MAAAVESRRGSLDFGKSDDHEEGADSTGGPLDGSTDDTMEDVSPPTTTSMGPPNNATSGSSGDSVNNGTTAPSAGAASSQTQPKVVQTAFIHKLYNMLEDQSIQHLISWSSSNESFLISPSNEFSKVLASYFKHTNISSFVRQLNMYGFHKVSDVFHTGSPDSPLWEFKHGGGSFKRGDVNGLRDIKRRASRHALIQRDTPLSASKMPLQPNAGLSESGGETAEARLIALENGYYDVHARLARSEEAMAMMSAKNQALTESLARCYQYHHEMLNIVSDSDRSMTLDSEWSNEYYARQLLTLRTVNSMQRDIAGQITHMQTYDTPRQSIATVYRPGPMPGDNGPPLSPRQLPQEDPARRYSTQTMSRPSSYRPLAPSPNRFSSVGGIANSSPGRSGARMPPAYSMQNGQAPAASMPMQSPFNTGRRHTSADIRTQGWHPGFQATMPAPSSVQSSVTSSNWPVTPQRRSLAAPSGVTAMGSGDQLIRDSLARYSFGGNAGNSPKTQAPRRRSATPSRPASPSANHSSGTQLPSMEPSWVQAPAIRLPFKDVFKSTGVASQDNSAPPTRRGSLANIQTLLNPAETVEQDEEDDAAPDEDIRKRKRIV